MHIYGLYGLCWENFSDWNDSTIHCHVTCSQYYLSFDECSQGKDIWTFILRKQKFNSHSDVVPSKGVTSRIMLVLCLIPQTCEYVLFSYVAKGTLQMWLKLKSLRWWNLSGGPKCNISILERRKQGGTERVAAQEERQDVDRCRDWSEHSEGRGRAVSQEIQATTRGWEQQRNRFFPQHL